jgi:PPK2 family polyphosphate:nucleotide phosphotransferase
MNDSPTALARTAARFRHDGRSPFSIGDTPTRIEPLYTSEDDRARQLDALTNRMDQAQNRMHAHGRYGLLVLFQALDAAGKDSTIRHVFKGINPSRFQISSFKKPGDEDLAHDFLWRSWQELPERGTIGIFNRSYYEEVLAVQVHPERLADHNLPEVATENLDRLWKQRYRDLVYFEDYLGRNGFPVIKFFLNVSKAEQGKRLISRLSDSEKQWKFSPNDLEERQHWDNYATVYETAINATASRHAPWYVIPSDDRRNQQLIIARIMTHLLEKLPTQFPRVEDKQAKRLIREIEKQDAP